MASLLDTLKQQPGAVVYCFRCSSTLTVYMRAIEDAALLGDTVEKAVAAYKDKGLYRILFFAKAEDELPMAVLDVALVKVELRR